MEQLEREASDLRSKLLAIEGRLAGAPSPETITWNKEFLGRKNHSHWYYEAAYPREVMSRKSPTQVRGRLVMEMSSAPEFVGGGYEWLVWFHGVGEAASPTTSSPLRIGMGTASGLSTAKKAVCAWIAALGDDGIAALLPEE